MEQQINLNLPQLQTHGRYANKKHTKNGNSTNFQNYPGRALFGIPKVPGGLLDAPGVSGISQAPLLSPEPAQMGSGRPQSDRVDLGGAQVDLWGSPKC